MTVKCQTMPYRYIKEKWPPLTFVMFWREAILSFAFLSWNLITSFFLISFINCLLLLFSSKSNLWNSTYNHVHYSIEIKLDKLTSKSWCFDASWVFKPSNSAFIAEFSFCPLSLLSFLRALFTSFCLKTFSSFSFNKVRSCAFDSWI